MTAGCHVSSNAANTLTKVNMDTIFMAIVAV